MKKLKFALSIIAFCAVLNSTNAQQIEQGVDRGGFGFSIGTTHLSPTGGLGRYFEPTTGLNISFDVRISRLNIGLYVDGVSMRLTSPLPSYITGHDRDIEIGDRMTFTGVSVPVGYVLINTNRFALIPFVSLIGGTSLTNHIYNNNAFSNERIRERGFTIVNTFSVGAGINTEFVLVRFNANSPFRRTPVPQSLNLRLNAGYNIPLLFNYTPARGNVFYARAGIVWWLGNM